MNELDEYLIMTGAEPTRLGSDANDLDVARALIVSGYKQVSRAGRRVARLPAGESGLEALKHRDPDAYAEIMHRAEQQAADYYRRMLADEEGHVLTLDVDEFAAFKKAGGEASW